MSSKSPVLDAPAARQPAGPGSDRVFGLFFAALFALAGAYGLWGGRAWGWAALAVTALLALLAIRAPRALHGANRLWFRFGALLARIVNPVVLAILFFLVVTPVALLMRAFRRRPLSLAFEPAKRSYWIARRPTGPAPESMRDQF